jgi:hypothetical protein
MPGLSLASAAASAGGAKVTIQGNVWMGGGGCGEVGYECEARSVTDGLVMRMRLLRERRFLVAGGGGVKVAYIDDWAAPDNRKPNTKQELSNPYQATDRATRPISSY